MLIRLGAVHGGFGGYGRHLQQQENQENWVFFWEGDFSCKKKILLFLIIFWGDFFVWRKIKFMPLSFCLGEFCKGCAGDECP